MLTRIKKSTSCNNINDTRNQSVISTAWRNLPWNATYLVQAVTMVTHHDRLLPITNARFPLSCDLLRTARLAIRS